MLTPTAPVRLRRVLPRRPLAESSDGGKQPELEPVEAGTHVDRLCELYIAGHAQTEFHVVRSMDHWRYSLAPSALKCAAPTVLAYRH